MDITISERQEKHSVWESYHPKRVSYILPTKNRAELLEKSLLLLRDIVKPQDELIIIDGGSYDNTRDVVERHRDFVDMFVSEPDGPGHATNKGILFARGRYIKHLADDELISPDGIEQAIGVLDAHPEIDLLVCGSTVYLTGETKPSYIYVPPGAHYGTHPDDILRFWTGSGDCFIIRRSLFAKVGIFSSTVVNDYEFIARCLFLKANVKFCRINLMENRATRGGLTYRKRVEALREKKEITKKYCSRLAYYLYCLEKNAFMRRTRLSLFARPIFRFTVDFRKKGVLGLIHDFQNKFIRKGLRRASEAPIWDGGLS